MDSRPRCASCRVPTTWPPQPTCQDRPTHYGHPRPLSGLPAMVHDLVSAADLRRTLP